MPRRSFKPDASFFRKIAMGAIGANAVREDLAQFGYQIAELERGATDTKIWKEVKRKRVRIPDLVGVRSGLRIEVRTKTSPSVQMSHSPDEAERAWDYGLVDSDWIAFPVCESVKDEDWSQGDLQGEFTCFRQQRREQFELRGVINYFTVGDLRRVRHDRGRRKGVVEASEYSIEWDAKFSTRTGPVRYIEEDPKGGQNRVSIENRNGRAYTWKVSEGLDILVDEGEPVQANHVFASAVHPIQPRMTALGDLDSDALGDRFLASHERTMRFTGVKLARLRADKAHVSAIRQLADDTEEDLYVRLEALSYLAAVADEPVAEAFEPYLNSGVDEDALEAVICIGEVENEAAIRTLDDLLHDSSRPYFLRSASAWALGHIRDEEAQRALIRAFSDQPLGIKEEALGGLVSLGDEAVPRLVGGLDSDDPSVAAGCAEALRRYEDLSNQQIERIVCELRSENPSTWSVWLVGSLPKEKTACRIANMQDIDAKVHYALSLLWSFSQSWISEHWDKYPLAHWPCTEE